MARPASRSTRQFPLWSSDISLGWKILRYVTFSAGAKNAAAGIWRAVFTEVEGKHIGYQIACTANCGLEPESRSTPTYISAREMMMYAGRAFGGGKSKTEGLSEAERAARRGKFGRILPLEDAVERVTAKVRSWPFPASRIEPNENAPYGDRAVRVYPNP